MTCTEVVRLNNLADALADFRSYKDGRRHFEKLNFFQKTNFESDKRRTAGLRAHHHFWPQRLQQDVSKLLDVFIAWRRLRSVLAKDSGIGTSPIALAQKMLPWLGTSFGLVPGDAPSFHCVRRGLRVETLVAVLRGLAGCPAGVWADDSHFVKL